MSEFNGNGGFTNGLTNVKRFLIMVEAHVPEDGNKGVLGGHGMQRLMGSLGDRLDDGDIDSYYTLCCEDRGFTDPNYREDVNYLARMGAILMQAKDRTDSDRKRDEELERLRAQLRHIKALLAGGEA